MLKTKPTPQTKVARYIEPVVTVKKEENYDIVHTSFQSMLSGNIMSVNSLCEIKKLY